MEEIEDTIEMEEDDDMEVQPASLTVEEEHWRRNKKSGIELPVR